PADSGTNRNAATPPGNTSPYGTAPPPGFGNQPTGSPPKQAPSSAYQSPPGFPTDTGAPPAQPAAASPAATLLQSMLMAPRDSQLRGEPVSLMQAVSSGRTRSEQTQRVDAYWDLCSSVADYYL